NIDENSTASNIQFDNLSSIIDEPTSSPTNAAFSEYLGIQANLILHQL
ncbi:unnamed protein product, partial [Rotaria socialis]